MSTEAIRYNRLAKEYERQNLMKSATYDANSPYFQALVRNGEDLLPYLVADIVTGDTQKRWQCAVVRQFAEDTENPVADIEQEYINKGRITESRNKELVVSWALTHLMNS